MSFLTNKHVVIAMIAAPVLAIIAYLGVDQMVTPDPVTARPGDSFPLVARSNCRYEGGKCTLANGNFRVDIETQDGANKPSLILDMQSEHPIQGIRFALMDAAGKELQGGSSSSTQITLERVYLQPETTLQLALKSSDVIFFVETQIDFLLHNNN